MLVHFLLFCDHWWNCFFQFSVDVQLAHRPKDRKNLVPKICCKRGALLYIMLCCACLFVKLGANTAGCRPGMWHQKRSGCVPLGYFYFHRGSQPMPPREPADVSARASRCSTPPVCLYFMKGNYLLNLPELFTNFPELFTKISGTIYKNFRNYLLNFREFKLKKARKGKRNSKFPGESKESTGNWFMLHTSPVVQEQNEQESA